MKSLSIIQRCLAIYQESEQSPTPNFQSTRCKNILQSLSNIKILETLSEQDFKTIIETQQKKFPMQNSELNEASNQFEKILDAVLHNDVVHLIKQKLLENCHK